MQERRPHAFTVEDDALDELGADRLMHRRQQLRKGLGQMGIAALRSDEQGMPSRIVQQGQRPAAEHLATPPNQAARQTQRTMQRFTMQVNLVDALLACRP